MKVDIQQYINSGALETYIIGAATPDEEQQVKYLQNQYPEVKYALQQLEDDFEDMARAMAVTPPPGAWNKIESELNNLITRQQTIPDVFNKHQQNNTRQNNGQQYIEVEAESSHMKVHKNWKWVFTAVFILSKVFLICAIYFYLENRQAQQQIQELKQELKVRDKG